jgi:predicted Zn-dependent protease
VSLAELAERALERTHGQAQVTVTRERSQLARFAGSRATQATEVDELRVDVLAVRDGATAAAATSEVDDEGLREVGDRAARAAEAAARAGGGGYPGLPAPGGRPRPHDGWDPATARMDPSRPGAALAAVFDQTGARGLEAAGVWTAGAVETAIASSSGLSAGDAATDAHVKVLCRGGGGRSGFAAATATSFARIDAAAVAGAAADKCAAGEPSELAPGDYPAVLDAHAVGSLLEFLATLAFNGLAHAEGRGALSGRLGQLVAAPGVNLSDSPRYPNTLPRAVDAEGVPKAPLPLVQDGVAHRVVHDTRSAAAAGGGARSTGHALAPGGAPSGPRPTNLVMVGGGAADVAALAAGIDRGIYVTRLWYVNPVHVRRTLLTGMTRDGTFLIEDGRITRPLLDLRFTDSVLGLLGRVEGLTARASLTSEAEFYGRRFATGVVCPAMRVGALRITGTTT